MWRDLHTTLTLDDAIALRGIMDVGLSRSHAGAQNAYDLQQMGES